MASEQQKSDKVSPLEPLKVSSGGLCGSIPAELSEDTPAFSSDTSQLLKHHGVYQQDDRDVRQERRSAGVEKDYYEMVRVKLPGGRLSAEQYLLCDELARQYGQNDMRVTSRQGLQLHRVKKVHLRNVIHDLNVFGKLTTLGGAGDVARNVTASPVADIDPRYQGFGEHLANLAQRISDTLMPRTRAYGDIWLNDEFVDEQPGRSLEYTEDLPKGTVEEPVYGPAYLPRKFKIGIATGFDNSVDVFTNDVGIVAVTEQSTITGYDVSVGGGMGFTPGKTGTYARLATPFAFVSEDELLSLLHAVVRVFRDHGDRADRNHARLKYLLDELGEGEIRRLVEQEAGRPFAPAKGIVPSAQPDYLGWSKQVQPGLNYVGVWLENGRIRDFSGSYKFKSGLRHIVQQLQLEVRLTPHHNLVLANIRDEDVASVQDMLNRYHIPTARGISALRRGEMACPGLPLCPMALAESERAMPKVMAVLEEMGYGDADVIVRMTGCPRSCARPRTAELGVVGRGPGRYRLYAGGSDTRLGEELVSDVPADALAGAIGALLDLWKVERNKGERFSGWVQRAGLAAIQKKLGYIG